MGLDRADDDREAAGEAIGTVGSTNGVIASPLEFHYTAPGLSEVRQAAAQGLFVWHRLR